MSLHLEKESKMNSGITVLIDGDILCYQCGFASQKNVWSTTVMGEDGPRASFNYKKEMKDWLKDNQLEDKDVQIEHRIEAEPVENALHSVKLFIHAILERCNTDKYKIYLTGEDNFREQIATIQPYKGNRSGDKPSHYQAIRDYLVNVWGAIVVDGMEADDAIAIRQFETTVIASIDKDLEQVPGWHLNWNKDEKPRWVTEEEATRNFYLQLLTGDRVDNIQGVPGIGIKKAENLLKGCKTEEEMYEKVFDEYVGYAARLGAYPIDQPHDALDMLTENAQLLWLVRGLDEEGKLIMWRIPE